MAVLQISKEKWAENWVCWTVLYKKHLPRKPILVKHKARKRLGLGVVVGAVLGMGRTRGTAPWAGGVPAQLIWGDLGMRLGLGSVQPRSSSAQLGSARLCPRHTEPGWEREGKNREGRRGGRAGCASLPARVAPSLWERSMLRNLLFYYSLIFTVFPSICSPPFSPGQELFLPLRQNVSELITWDTREEDDQLQVKKLALGIGFLFLSPFASFRFVFFPPDLSPWTSCHLSPSAFSCFPKVCLKLPFCFSVFCLGCFPVSSWSSSLWGVRAESVPLQRFGNKLLKHSFTQKGRK